MGNNHTGCAWENEKAPQQCAQGKSDQARQLTHCCHEAVTRSDRADLIYTTVRNRATESATMAFQKNAEKLSYFAFFFPLCGNFAIKRNKYPTVIHGLRSLLSR